MERRLADLEQTAAANHQAALQAWVDSLTDDELDALLAEDTARDPVRAAAMDALSDEDLERLGDGKMLDAEWQQHLQRAQERINAV
jgi:hypothetical protein